MEEDGSARRFFLKRGIGIRNTLITTFGLEKNKYSSVFSSVVTMDDLFVL